MLDNHLKEIFITRDPVNNRYPVLVLHLLHSVLEILLYIIYPGLSLAEMCHITVLYPLQSIEASLSEGVADNFHY